MIVFSELIVKSTITEKDSELESQINLFVIQMLVVHLASALVLLQLFFSILSYESGKFRNFKNWLSVSDIQHPDM